MVDVVLVHGTTQSSAGFRRLVATLQDALPTVSRCDLSAVYAEIPVEDPSRVPSTYLLPTGDRTLCTEWMARVARERLHIDPTMFPGAHNFYVAKPDDVAAVIATAAEAQH